MREPECRGNPDEYICLLIVFLIQTHNKNISLKLGVSNSYTNMYVDSPAFNENRDSEFEFYNFPFYPLKLDLLGDGK